MDHRRLSRYPLGAGLLILALSVRADAADPPKVVAIWPAGLFETRVVFDGPVDPILAKTLVDRTIAFDTSLPHKPIAYTPRKTPAPADAIGTLKIAAAHLDATRRVLTLTTDPHPRAATYTLDLSTPTLKCEPLFYDLGGVEVVIDDGSENPSTLWKGWWPVFEPKEAQERLAGSPEHDAAFALLKRKGRLSLTSFVTLPKGPIVLNLSTNGPVEATFGGEPPNDDEDGKKAKAGKATFRTESSGEPILLTITVPTGEHPPVLTLDFEPHAKSSRGSLMAGRLTLPWAPPTPPPIAPLENVPDLKNGDPKKGAIIFAGAESKCANCHKVRGQGGSVGPDLSGLVGRDRTEVYLDIFNPSARIHPDYVSYTIALKDGKVLVGTVRVKGGNDIVVTDTEAKVTQIPRADIDDIRPSAASIMPVGLVGAIGEANLRDLIAFLTTDTPAVPAATK